MGDHEDEESWFEASSEVDVLDGDGQPIGKLRPGKSYRALTVGPFEVTVEGPGGVVGHVDRSSIRLIEAEPSSDDPTANTFAPPATPAPDPTPAAQNPEEPPPVFAPAGWLSDPDNPEIFLRYWDGEVWTEHRSPMPPGGLASDIPTAESATTAEVRAAGHQGLARTIGVFTAIWAALGLLRVVSVANGWGVTYSRPDRDSLWWVFTSTWSVSFGNISPNVLFFPDGGIKVSPLWMFTAVIGVVGLLVAIAPSRGKRQLLIGLLAAHVAATWIFGVNIDFFGDVVRVLLYASILPVTFIVALVVSNRPVAGTDQ